MDCYGPSARSRWLDVDWREHRRWVVAGDCTINLVELGSGPPLVFIHGLGGSWTNWLENICEFAEDHRVVALDLSGFGGSQVMREPVSIPRLGQMLDLLLDELGIDSAALVGNSMGGLVGAELALSRPERVERLCLVAAAGLSIERLPIAHAMRILAPLERVISFSGGLAAAHAQTFARRGRLRRLSLLHVATHPDRLPAPIAAEIIAGAGRPGLLPGLRAMSEHPIRERLHEIACPTLIVWGERDRMVPLRDADDFERLIPGARKVVYPDTGHVPMIERPGCFNEDLRAFLAQAPGAWAPVSRVAQAGTQTG